MSLVKFLDLKAQYPLIKTEILNKFEDIIENSSFVSGKYVKEFEEEFARYNNVKNCVVVDNGTNALLLSLLAHGIGVGDEVIVPVNTFIASAEAVTLVGAKPVFVDVDENTYLIDVNKLALVVTADTKAIIPVHLYGQCADMDQILSFAKKHNLAVIEDCCQAHGLRYKSKMAGSIGNCGAFSFYPGKNLGAWGEGGAITTNNDAIAEKICLLRDHGSKMKYQHEVIGGNFRIDEFQGAVLSTKIKHLEKWNDARRANANLYLELLKDTDKVVVPVVAEYNKPVWHLFVIRSFKRDELINYLKQQEVQTGIHYPVPLHLTPAYSSLGYKKGDFPVAEKVQSEIVSLPMYAELTKEEIERVVSCIKKFPG